MLNSEHNQEFESSPASLSISQWVVKWLEPVQTAVPKTKLGLKLDAQFHWEGSEIAFTQQISLSTPAGDGSYRKQTLEQAAQVPLAEVIEFARFDGLESDRLKQQRGLPLAESRRSSGGDTGELLDGLNP